MARDAFDPRLPFLLEQEEQASGEIWPHWPVILLVGGGGRKLIQGSASAADHIPSSGPGASGCNPANEGDQNRYYSAARAKVPKVTRKSEWVNVA